MNALTGLRCFAALNLVAFHFSNPQWFGPLAPVVNAGFVSVSYFILLSGFVLAYNYHDRARAGELDTKRFLIARFTRIYPVYLLSLLLALPNLHTEYGAHTHFMYRVGLVLTPLLLQGWIPATATFLNTPAWTMSAEAAYYVAFPWLAKLKPARNLGRLLFWLTVVWLAGMIPGALYMYFNPDGIQWPDRYSYGHWLWALKYTPYSHAASFVFGVMLADLDHYIPRASHLRTALAVIGFGGIYGLLSLGPLVPYAILHDGLLMPLFAAIVLGLAGENPVSKALSIKPLVVVGEASFCLYLLHFNLWQILHHFKLPELLHMKQFDPWFSYGLLIVLALGALHFIEKPAQRKLRQWLSA